MNPSLKSPSSFLASANVAELSTMTSVKKNNAAKTISTVAKNQMAAMAMPLPTDRFTPDERSVEASILELFVMRYPSRRYQTIWQEVLYNKCVHYAIQHIKIQEKHRALMILAMVIREMTRHGTFNRLRELGERL